MACPAIKETDMNWKIRTLAIVATIALGIVTIAIEAAEPVPQSTDGSARPQIAASPNTSARAG